jgi:hypothetical protein
MADRRRGPGLRPPPAREDCLRLRRGLLARSPGSAGSAGRQQAHSWPRLRARLRRRIIRVGRRSSLSRTASSRGRGRGPFPRSALVDLPDRCCGAVQSEHGTDRWVDRAGLHERHEVAPLPDRVARFDRSVSSDRFPNPPGGFHRNGLSIGPGSRGAGSFWDRVNEHQRRWSKLSLTRLIDEAARCQQQRAPGFASRSFILRRSKSRRVRTGVS